MTMRMRCELVAIVQVFALVMCSLEVLVVAKLVNSGSCMYSGKPIKPKLNIPGRTVIKNPPRNAHDCFDEDGHGLLDAASRFEADGDSNEADEDALMNLSKQGLGLREQAPLPSLSTGLGLRAILRAEKLAQRQLRLPASRQSLEEHDTGGDRVFSDGQSNAAPADAPARDILGSRATCAPALKVSFKMEGIAPEDLTQDVIDKVSAHVYARAGAFDRVCASRTETYAYQVLISGDWRVCQGNGAVDGGSI
jgi:hypothetical protein